MKMKENKEGLNMEKRKKKRGGRSRRSINFWLENSS
jgi:hypothetical protein